MLRTYFGFVEKKLRTFKGFLEDEFLIKIETCMEGRN